MNGSIRVLHVDDDPEYAELSATLLERKVPRIGVVSESNASDGLARLADDAIDCVISDFEMPGMNGLEFLAAVRERHPDLPFILFTANGSESVASEAIEAGVTHYLQKGPGTERYELLANRVVKSVEHARAEQRAREQERINRVVRDINRGLVRATTRAEIDETVCASLADSAPYTFAWIGETASGSNVVTPRASAGIETDYLDAITVTVGPDDPTGQGPVGRALRTGEIAVSQDITSDPAFDPWREQARERGFASVAAVPLDYEGESYGVLVVYADRNNTFDEDERTLLDELGADIAHAICTISLRETLDRYESILQSLGDPVYTLDTDGNYTFVNDAFIEQTGYSREELLGEHVSLVIEAEEVDQGETLIQDLLGSEGRSHGRYETERITADGEHIQTENHVALLTDAAGRFQGTVGIQRDITARKQQERDLKRQNERLDRLASLLSHELRNPISVADGYLELLREDVESEHLDSVADAIDRMDEMVENLLALAREGDPVEHTAPVDIASIAEQCWYNVITDDATLDVEADVTVLADASRLRHVFENLFENSVAHGGENVTIRVGNLPDGEGFYIEDDGPGIPADKREQVFESGVSLSARGTGFGLAIVEEIVDAHGWEVDITRSTMGGARFEVRGVDVV